MSELTLTESEVLTDNTDVICSTSIERIVTGRNAALAQIETLIQQLDDISTLTSNIGGGKANEWGVRQYRYDCWLMDKPETAIKAITQNIDRSIWKDLMNKSECWRSWTHRHATSGTTAWKRTIFPLSVKRIFSAPLSNYIRVKRGVRARDH
jgi:hypothetical protein